MYEELEFKEERECEFCEGSGFVSGFQCSYCTGLGFEEVDYEEDY